MNAKSFEQIVTSHTFGWWPRAPTVLNSVLELLILYPRVDTTAAVSVLTRQKQEKTGPDVQDDIHFSDARSRDI